jgi:hypothetical protein
MSNVAQITTTITNASVDEVKSIHSDLGSLRADDKKYCPKFEAYHAANIAHCIKQARRGHWGGIDQTIGELAAQCGEMKLANRLAIAQSGVGDTPASKRGVVSLVTAWVANHEIDWGN